ncbi:MAG TPA: IPTL-CTERM sorting domain-containing protein [Thermodesulfobacteriota bacterium]|nr:IPTL-CTERM sorting domain-containing protein [Thermodesulfobacteriota bacterium]
MKGLILLTLLSVIFVSDYAMAQGCPCDTLELSNGTTGNDIVELLCPGGELGDDTKFSLDEIFVEVNSASEGYDVASFPGDATCVIGQEGTLQVGAKLDDQEALICRNSLIERCGLNINPIPTLSQWGMIAMAGVLGVIGLIVAARRRKAAA